MRLYIESVLSLLTATILADERVFASEIDAFIKGAANLEITRNSEPKLSEAKLLVWYEMNNGPIKEKLTSPNFKNWFYGLLDILSEFTEKDSLLAVMKKIAKADGEIHANEKTLIDLAARYWNIDSSRL